MSQDLDSDGCSRSVVFASQLLRQVRLAGIFSDHLGQKEMWQ